MILCALADLPDPGARGPFAVESGDGRTRKVFLVHTNGQVRAFLDTCPHVGVPLEMEQDRFLDLTGSEIVCSVHGARFDPQTGACLWGPCRGRSLTRVEIRRIGDQVAVTIPLIFS